LTKSDSQGIIRIKNETVSISSTFGSKDGNYSVGPLNSFKLNLPTNLYSNYTYSLKLFDRGISYDLNMTNKASETFDLQLIDVSKHFSIWDKVLKEMQIDLFVNDVKMYALDSKFSFYGLFHNFKILLGIEIKTISPTTLIPAKKRISLEIKTKETWNYFGLIQIKYENDFNEIQVEKCERTNDLNTIKCLSPSWNKACNVSISLSLSNGNYIKSQKKLKIYDHELVGFDSISPSTIFNSIQFVSIKGSSFLNDSTIKIKYSNNKMEEVLTSKLIENDTIISPSPSSFLIENMAFPFTLNVDVSFDNEISFLKTNLKVQVNSFEMLNLIPPRVQSATPFNVTLKLSSLLKTSALTLKLKSPEQELTLQCNDDYSTCSYSVTRSILKGIYDLYLASDSFQILIPSSKFVIYGNPFNLKLKMFQQHN
jgi:hypothetical protein